MPKKRIVRNKEEKIKRIFQTFVDLINKEGYEKITTRQIAKHSDLSIGTIYRYFPEGKPSIISEFLDRSSNEIINIDFIKDLNKKNPLEAIKHYIKNHLESHRSNYEIHKGLDQAILANREAFRKQEKIMQEMIEKIVERLKDIKFFKDIPKDKLIKNFTLIFNLVDSTIHRHLFMIPLFESDGELIDFLSRLVILVFQDRLLK
ncbi:MAG: TetR/AcrR family transcriptional regulator [Candidatus Helarchaeota archaeon]